MTNKIPLIYNEGASCGGTLPSARKRKLSGATLCESPEFVEISVTNSRESPIITIGLFLSNKKEYKRNESI